MESGIHNRLTPAFCYLLKNNSTGYPDPLIWTLGKEPVHTLSDLRNKDLERLKRLMAFVFTLSLDFLIKSNKYMYIYIIIYIYSIYSGHLAINHGCYRPRACPGSSSNFLDGRFRSTRRRHECSQIHGRILALQWDKIGMSNKHLEVRQSIFACMTV